MVYCKLRKISEDRKSAVYDCGTVSNDMTGSVVIYSDGRLPEVTREPKGDAIWTSQLYRMYGEYKIRLMNGDFPNKMSLEY